MFPYTGGKKSYTKWIEPLLPERSEFDTYVEVFGGAFWVYWMAKRLPVKTNVYNDFNRHLTNVFNCASTDPVKFETELFKLYPEIGSREKFIEYRDEVFAIYGTQFKIPDYTLAAKYMFLQMQIFTGGNGLTEKSNVYYNEKFKPKFWTFTEKFKQEKYLERLSQLTQTENMDCRDLIRKYDSEKTLFYIDPPYYNLEKYYTEDAFGHDDHVELLELLKTIKGKFALSYYYFDALEEILPRDQFVWHEEVTYTNNGLQRKEGLTRKDGKPAKGFRPERVELLIMNYKKETPNDLFEF